ncbi:flagellar basal body P-ring biosynthesis protein [Mycolicibacterium litorale]|uniref:Flagellar basal body P-ring biosynthesis protein n=1 Tax=Mycolicibacterium litorale TaxID=758802 RepID=A0A6S6PBC1_9MYCO|nr:SAF domain-containing protein [Mycolicibacterium litorale]BCI55021.1 flagellar basal body P-ring biosynthesis protein [Mycolicibacterium litorale]
MGESLAPTPLARLSRLRPDWCRTVAARRIAAAALVVLAAVAAVRSDPDGEQVDVVVAAGDLTPGTQLAAHHVRVERRPVTTVPDGATTDPAAVVGVTLAGPARRGEVLTDVRLLGPRIAEAAAGRDARIVSLHLADGALVDLVRTGDVVDVLAAPASETGGGARPRVIATRAVVVLVSEKAQGPGAAGERAVLVALPEHAANEVAGASLTQAITLTFH